MLPKEGHGLSRLAFMGHSILLGLFAISHYEIVMLCFENQKKLATHRRTQKALACATIFSATLSMPRPRLKTAWLAGFQVKLPQIGAFIAHSAFESFRPKHMTSADPEQLMKPKWLRVVSEIQKKTVMTCEAWSEPTCLMWVTISFGRTFSLNKIVSTFDSLVLTCSNKCWVFKLDKSNPSDFSPSAHCQRRRGVP